MNTILGLGKYLFALPLLVFASFHFMNASAMAPMAMGSTALVYVSGVALAASSVSMLIGKYDKLATVLLAVLMLIFVFAIHVPAVSGGDQMAMSGVLKDTIIAGASLLYASNTARDKSVIG